MSKSLESLVWKSDLNAELKPVAAVMADMGNDDGLGIYPSVAYLAWLLSRSERAIQTALKKLMEIGVLNRVGFATGGRGLKPRYHLYGDRLPRRPDWQETRKGADIAPFTKNPEKGAGFSIKGEVNDVKGAESAPDPLVDPLVNRERRKRGKSIKQEADEPPQIAAPFQGQEFLQVLSEFEALRRRMKHPLVGDGRKRMFAQFEIWGEHAATEALTVSVTNDYRGVFLPKNGNGFNGNGAARGDYRGPVKTAPEDSALREIRQNCRRCNGTNTELVKVEVNGKMRTQGRMCKHELFEETASA